MSDTIWKDSYCLLKELWFICWFVVFTSCSIIFHTYGDITIMVKGCMLVTYSLWAGRVFIELHHLCHEASVFLKCPNLGTFYNKQRVLRNYSNPNSPGKMNNEMNQYIFRACTSKQVELMKTKFLKMKTRHNISQMKLFTIMISWLVDDRSVTWTSFCDRSVTWTSFCDRSVTCTPFWAMFSL